MDKVIQYYSTLLSPVLDALTLLLTMMCMVVKVLDGIFYTRHHLIRSFIIIFCYTRVSILRDSGQIWPTKAFRPAREDIFSIMKK